MERGAVPHALSPQPERFVEESKRLRLRLFVGGIVLDQIPELFRQQRADADAALRGDHAGALEQLRIDRQCDVLLHRFHAGNVMHVFYVNASVWPKAYGLARPEPRRTPDPRCVAVAIPDDRRRHAIGEHVTR